MVISHHSKAQTPLGFFVYEVSLIEVGSLLKNKKKLVGLYCMQLKDYEK